MEKNSAVKEMDGAGRNKVWDLKPRGEKRKAAGSPAGPGSVGIVGGFKWEKGVDVFKRGKGGGKGAFGGGGWGEKGGGVGIREWGPRRGGRGPPKGLGGGGEIAGGALSGPRRFGGAGV